MTSDPQNQQALIAQLIANSTHVQSRTAPQAGSPQAKVAAQLVETATRRKQLPSYIAPMPSIPTYWGQIPGQVMPSYFQGVPGFATYPSGIKQ